MTDLSFREDWTRVPAIFRSTENGVVQEMKGLTEQKDSKFDIKPPWSPAFLPNAERLPGTDEKTRKRGKNGENEHAD